MEADWDELARIPMPPPSPHAMPTIATAVAFDDVMELLWTGNEYVGAYLGWKVSTITNVMFVLPRVEFPHFAGLN